MEKKKKIGVIGDIHCCTIWKMFVTNNIDIDKWVFIGDYVDSFTHLDEEMINNLADIIQYKKDNLEKVVLLLGNHDIQYTDFPNYRCSGFRAGIQPTISYLFQENKELFQIAYQYKNYLFTHAGVSAKWFKWMKEVFEEIENKYSPEDLAEAINIMSKTKDSFFLHSVGQKRGGLRGFYGGVTWADRDETMEGIIPNFHQIVGHTPVKKIETINKFMGTLFKDRSITYIDVLPKCQEFLKLEL